ncbi:MAG: LamG-like jellyroll fold domain-containing protein, partial [Verrucomicrobiota bacterium]
SDDDDGGHYYEITFEDSEHLWRSGEWVHHAFTWDMSDDEAGDRAKYFLNGEELTNGNVENGGDLVVDDFKEWEYEPYIGARNSRDSLDRPFDGYMDDFRVYDDRLTESQIEAVMIPEPGSFVLFIGGFLALAAVMFPRRPTGSASHS